MCLKSKLENNEVTVGLYILKKNYFLKLSDRKIHNQESFKIYIFMI